MLTKKEFNQLKVAINAMSYAPIHTSVSKVSVLNLLETYVEEQDKAYTNSLGTMENPNPINGELKEEEDEQTHTSGL